MQSLFLRFFLSFWLIIGIIISAAATGGFWYAERVRDSIEDFEMREPLLAASAALESGGRTALTKWLKDYPSTPGITLYIIDDHGQDILERTLSGGVKRSFQRHREHLRSRSSGRAEPRNLRRSRHLSQLVGVNGSTYTFFVSTSLMQSRIHEAIWGSTDVRVLLLIFAVLVSGTVSYALASAISRPVRKLRSAAVTLADGDLDVRVADAIGRRRDELGMLGRDFDLMASKLQRAAAQQTELSRNISHELRSPLARMRVAVELARRKAGDMSEFERLEKEAERLDALIGQILSYAKLDAGPQQLSKPVDLAEVINEVVENVNYECEADAVHGVSVTIDGLADSTLAIEISGHHEVLVSAIENVVRNAVKHSPPRGIVRIAVVPDDKNVVIRVKDAGPGVAPDELTHLFEPFFRTRASSESDSNGGTGLGLAIARRAVHLHRGQISAENHPDAGLSIVITLPRD